MKTMKLAIGTLSGVLALALLGGRANAQDPRVITRGDARGGVATTSHPIIYDHEVRAPAAPVRHLLIHADGTIRLVDGAASPRPLASDKLDAAALAKLKGAIAAAAGDANYVVRTGAVGRSKSLSGGLAPSPAGPATGGAAQIELRTQLDAMAVLLARRAVTSSR